MRWVHIITCCFAHLSILWLAYEDYRALRGMYKSVCKCLLLKQNRHLIPTGQELQHCTLWNLNSHSDYGDPPGWPCYSLAQVSHSSQYSLNTAHTRLREPSLTVLYVGWTPRARRSLCLGLMAPMGPTYPSVCAGLFNSLKSTELWL